MSYCQNIATDCQSLTYRSDGGNDDRALTTGLMEVALTGMGGYIVEDTPEGLALEIRTIGIRNKIEVHLRLFEDDLLDAELFATDTQRHHTDQLLCHLRYLSETVCQTLTISSQGILQVVAASEVIKFPVEQHTLRITGHILVGEVHLEV